MGDWILQPSPKLSHVIHAPRSAGLYMAWGVQRLGDPLGYKARTGLTRESKSASPRFPFPAPGTRCQISHTYAHDTPSSRFCCLSKAGRPFASRLHPRPQVEGACTWAPPAREGEAQLGFGCISDRPRQGLRARDMRYGRGRRGMMLTRGRSYTRKAPAGRRGSDLSAIRFLGCDFLFSGTPTTGTPTTAMNKARTISSLTSS